MVAKPQANTTDSTRLPESHTIAHSVSKRTDEGGQLVGKVCHDE